MELLLLRPPTPNFLHTGGLLSTGSNLKTQIRESVRKKLRSGQVRQSQQQVEETSLRSKKAATCTKKNPSFTRKEFSLSTLSLSLSPSYNGTSKAKLQTRGLISLGAKTTAALLARYAEQCLSVERQNGEQSRNQSKVAAKALPSKPQ